MCGQRLASCRKVKDIESLVVNALASDPNAGTVTKPLVLDLSNIIIAERLSKTALDITTTHQAAVDSGDMALADQLVYLQDVFEVMRHSGGLVVNGRSGMFKDITTSSAKSVLRVRRLVDGLRGAFPSSVAPCVFRMTRHMPLFLCLQLACHMPCAPLATRQLAPTNTFRLPVLPPSHVCIRSQGKPKDQRGTFLPNGFLHVGVLDGIVDGSAFLSECIRQSAAAADDVVKLWVRSINEAVAVLQEWVPQGVTVDEGLLANENAQQRLLSNEYYPKLPAAEKTLRCSIDCLTKMNSPDDMVVEQEVIDSWIKVCDDAVTIVVTTYVLYLLLERLPKMSDMSLRTAEIEHTRKSLQKAGRVMPAFLDKALTEANEECGVTVT